MESLVTILQGISGTGPVTAGAPLPLVDMSQEGSSVKSKSCPLTFLKAQIVSALHSGPQTKLRAQGDGALQCERDWQSDSNTTKASGNL